MKHILMSNAVLAEISLLTLQIASSSTHTAPSVSTITSQPSRSTRRGRGRERGSSTAIGHWLSRRSGHSRKLLRSELEEENTALREIVLMTMEHSADSGAEVGSMCKKQDFEAGRWRIAYARVSCYRLVAIPSKRSLRRK